MATRLRQLRNGGPMLPAYLFGALAAFVAGVDLSRAIRPDLLTDPDPTWVIPRILLNLVVLAVSMIAGGAGVAFFLVLGKLLFAREALEPLALGRRTIGVLAAAALVLGVWVRFAWLSTIPPVVWYDEVLPLPATAALDGSWRDFGDAIRSVPAHVRSTAMVGVVYLEGSLAAFRRFGTSLFTLRAQSAFWASLSLITAMLLARSLLPRGGAALAALVLAGLRWQIILARYAWNVLALAPVLDLATVLLVRARRKSSRRYALLGGLVAGLGAHLYLGSWIAAMGLAGFLAWPSERGEIRRRRVAQVAAFGAGFLLVASPIFLLKKDRETPYFARATDQSLMKDVRLYRSWMIPFAIVSDSFKAPWIIPDPVRRQDLPQSRLGWIVGIPVALAFLRALRWPRSELSALVFPHAAAATLASLRWGFPGHPNGYRFAYLTTLTAVVAAAGVLSLLSVVPAARRRSMTWIALGLLAVSGLLGARDALFRWGENRDTFVAYHGEETLIGRSALRWERFGSVRVEPGIQTLVTQWVREFRLDPENGHNSDFFGSARGVSRCFEIRPPDATPPEPHRAVEIVRDGWGKVYAVVFATPCRLGS